MSNPLWLPSKERIEQSNLTAFMRAVERAHGIKLADYAALYQWSIDRPEDFWQAIWRFGQVRGTPGRVVLQNGDRMPGAVWFPDARLNFAENLLRAPAGDESDAIVFWGEDKVRRRVSHRELYEEVSRMTKGL
ncbi:MAG TPA: acetyl-coenzyme A synthetase N-terminal domain-containing protein, partial [Burkholderiales bacterium]|nr:acetyl-coenzyme A synthetase N-terminal domain-containing protein [Burkholderiales bacterium]